MQRALILATGDQITLQSLVIETDLLVSVNESLVNESVNKQPANESKVVFSGDALKEDLWEQERQMILDALQQEAGRKKETAERLGISPRTLRYKLAKMRDEGYL